MIDFIPFIKKFLNKKDRTLDEQIDDIMTAVGGSSEGAILASAIGSWVLPSSNTAQTWTAPYDGVYRFVLVGNGGSEAAGSVVIIILRCVKGAVLQFLKQTSKTDVILKYSDRTCVEVRGGGSSTESKIYENVLDNNELKIIGQGIYENFQNAGDVPLIIPEFRPLAMPQVFIPTAIEINNIYVAHRGLLDYASSTGVYNTRNRVFIIPSIGYGAAGYSVPDSSAGATSTPANPGCCIITLLKKE